MSNKFLDYFAEQANFNKRNIYPIFIVLTRTDGPFAKATKFATGQYWSHATIAFNPELNPYYTFGCRSLKPLKFGLMTNGEDAYYDTDEAEFVVYVMYVNKKQYIKAQRKLEWFIDHKEELDYNWIGIPRLLLKKPHEYQNRWFCSQFVMKLIGETMELSKDPSLWSPGDIEGLENISKVCHGSDLREYNPEITKRNLIYIQKKQFEKVQLECVIDNMVEQEELITEEAQWSTKNKYPVYIVLQHAGMLMSNIISGVTGDEFSHASIAFNTSMYPLYSFGTKCWKPLKFGFMVHQKGDPYYIRNNVRYAIYVMYMDRKRYLKLIKRLQFFIDNADKMKYSVPYLITVGLQIPVHLKYKYVCSQFVADLLNEASPLPKDPSLWRPSQLGTLDNITLIDKGDNFRFYDEKVVKKNLKKVRAKEFSKISFGESVQEEQEDIKDLLDGFYMETTVSADKVFFKERVGTKVDLSLAKPETVRKFNQFVNDYVNRNIEKLTKSGPCDMIAFTDKDHKFLFDLFGIEYTIDARPGVTSPNEITTWVKEFSKAENIKLTFFGTNPSQVLLYYVIRYFTVHPDQKSLNAALSIYALCVYPLMFHKYFPNGVLEPFMKYTIDNLTNKFIIKKSKHLFGALVYSISNSYNTHKKNFPKGNDAHMIAWVERIRNDQNSLFKKIANEYMKNWEEGKAARQTNELFDGDAPIVDDLENATTVVQNIVQKVTLPIIENGVDILRAEAAAKMSQVSVSDCRFFLTLVIIDKNVDQIQSLIESILFLYIYEDKRSERDIRSEYFLAWGKSLFKKTNSKNPNVNNINNILNTWASEAGIDKKFARVASQINYKKAMFFYIILCIQKNM